MATKQQQMICQQRPNPDFAYSGASSAAEIISNNEDLLAYILSRVPVKPLLRFKCVSKQWLSLISNPHFSKTHSYHNHSSVSGIFICVTPGLVSPRFQFLSLSNNENTFVSPCNSLNFVHDHAGIKILQSCNGFLFCSNIRKTYSTRNFYVYNPTINQFFTLSLPPSTSTSVHKPSIILGLALAFDPHKSPYYKVVCVRSASGSTHYSQVEIYSSENHTWCLSGSPFVAPFDMVFDNGVFWNGSVHWISPTGFNTLYFDIEQERLGEMPPFPENDHWGRRKFRYFKESGDCLNLIEVYGPSATQFNVLEMSKDYSSWFVRYTVDLRGVVDNFPEMILNCFDTISSPSYAFVVVSLVQQDHGGEEPSLLLHIPGKIISYNLRDKTFKKMCDFSIHGPETRVSYQFALLDCYQYIETLARVS